MPAYTYSKPEAKPAASDQQTGDHDPIDLKREVRFSGSRLSYGQLGTDLEQGWGGQSLRLVEIQSLLHPKLQVMFCGSLPHYKTQGWQG